MLGDALVRHAPRTHAVPAAGAPFSVRKRHEDGVEQLAVAALQAPLRRSRGARIGHGSGGCGWRGGVVVAAALVAAAVGVGGRHFDL